MKVIDLLIGPMGAGTSFLGYVQHLITQENPTIELPEKKDNCWDEYVLKYKLFEPLTPIQKEYKKVINNIDNATQGNYKQFADAIDDGAELMFHYYPFGLSEFVTLNNRLFLSCNKERFFGCYKLGLIKNNGLPVDCRGEQNDDLWYEECNKEWQNHVQTKIKCTFDYFLDYDDLFVNFNKGVIEMFLNSTPNRKHFDTEAVVQLFKDYSKKNQGIL